MEGKWKQSNGKLIKTFEFKNFKDALAFINTIGEIAESMNHHPKIINVYSRVSLELWTHDHNDITELDFQLADAIDQKIQ